jgi:O-antigen/teichoic acid export membrane protein
VEKAGAQPDGSRAVRHAGLLLGLRALDLAVGVAVMALVPRALGPQEYGRYALLTSVTFWLAFVSGLGSMQVVGRHLPELLQAGRAGAARSLLGRLLQLRLATGSGVALAYFAVARAWLPEIEASAALFAAVAVAVRTVGALAFAVFLGRNQAGRWALAEPARRLVALPLVLFGYARAGLPGACAGAFAADLLVMSGGLAAVAAHLGWPRPEHDAEVRERLRFGWTLLLGNVLLLLPQRAGEVLVRAASGDYALVAYFSLAAAAQGAVAGAFSQLGLAFLPLMTGLRSAGRTEALREAAERLLRFLTIVAAVAVPAALLLGERAVVLLAGAAYRPAASVLVVLTLALVPYAFGGVLRTLALVHDRMTLLPAAAALQLAVFVAAGVPLVRAQGALGAAVAVVLGAATYAGCLAVGLRGTALPPLQHVGRGLGLGALFLGLGLARGSAAGELVGLVVLLVGYPWMLRAVGAVRPGELGALWRVVRRRGEGALSGAGAGPGPGG